MTTHEADFRVLDATDELELAEWVRLWERWPEREVFAHPAYLQLFAAEGAARCAVLVTDAGTVLYPFLLRTIPGAVGDNHERDTTTPYGYGGPFEYGGSGETQFAEFWSRYDDWAAKSSVVSEFVRFSLDTEARLTYPGDVVFKQDNIVRELSLSAEDLWMDFDHKVRKNVKKALRSDVHVEIDVDGSRFEDFFDIYESTMDRREASKGYYFGREFFESIHRNLAGQFVYFHAIHEGLVVSTELVLSSADTLYSFLGGTKSESFDLRPNDLLKHEVMLWGISNGKKRFVLGGGFQPDDGIFRYKRAFAPGGAVPFSVGNRILNAERYSELTSEDQRAAQVESSYFPSYRQ